MSIDYLKINNVAMPCPTGISIQTNDLDSENTTRSVGTGKMHRERIRQGVYQCDYSWEELTDAELATIVQAISPASVDIRFWFGSYKDAHGYFTAGAAEMTAAPNGEPRWSYSATFTEF
ncbi:MAG: hypothetical protein J5715_03945 [Clostridiales bacterium]|nr:hypothetical protein [Clostridiales bacterium]